MSKLQEIWAEETIKLYLIRLFYFIEEEPEPERSDLSQTTVSCHLSQGYTRLQSPTSVVLFGTWYCLSCTDRKKMRSYFQLISRINTKSYLWLYSLKFIVLNCPDIHAKRSICQGPTKFQETIAGNKAVNCHTQVYFLSHGICASVDVQPPGRPVILSLAAHWNHLRSFEEHLKYGQASRF